MQRAFLLVAVLLLLPLAAAAAVTVTVTSPPNNSQVSSPFTLTANASSNYPITGWQVYLDGRSVYSAGWTNSINTSINASQGNHQLATRAWDSTGAYGTVYEQITVNGGGGVTVTVTSPPNNSQVSSPFTLTANASSNYPIVGWQVYLDGNSVYSAGSTNSINTSINASQGNHQLVTRAWDSTGAYGSVYEQITVNGSGGGNGLPTPPPWAQWFYNIDDRSGWDSCNSPGCAGGSGNGSYWMAQNQSYPSRDGASTEFFNSGVWANALWWQKLGPNDGVHNFLYDLYVWVDDSSQNATQALEYDVFQFVGGYNYMIGTQCDYGYGVWDTWDTAAGQWYRSSIPCPKFSPNTWHHIQWYMTTNPSSHQYTYVTLVVDGNSTPVNITENARYLGWSDNVGVQFQLDVNATGQGYHEWTDSVTLAVW